MISGCTQYCTMARDDTESREKEGDLTEGPEML